jgi:hypothetical protein
VAAEINVGYVRHYVHVINRENSVAALAERFEIGTFGNIVGKNHHARRIVAENFLGAGSFEGSGEIRIRAFTESHYIFGAGSGGSQD